MCIITLKFKRSLVTGEYLNIDICIFQYLCLPIPIIHIIEYISIFILLSRVPTNGGVVPEVQGPGYFSGSWASTNEFVIYEILLGMLILILNNIIVMLKINTTSIIIYNYFIVRYYIICN